MTKIGGMTLIKGNQDKKLDEFFGTKKEKKKEKPYQANIILTLEEEEELKAGHNACLEKMPLYEYTKRAVLEKAKADVERRKKIDEAIKDLDFSIRKI